MDRVDRQPLTAQVKRLQDALKHLGAPLGSDVVEKLKAATDDAEDATLTSEVQRLLDPLCLAAVVLRSDQSPVVVPAKGTMSLEEQGWRTLLIKVVNPAESRARLRMDSPNARPLAHSPADEVASRWLGLSVFDGQPLTPSLTGLPLEYRIVEVYSRDAADRKARIEFAAPVPGGVGANRATSIIADWRFDKDTAGWEAQNQIELMPKGGALQLVATGDDPFMAARLAEPAKPGNYVLRFWGKADESGVGQVFWWTQERPQPDGGRLASFNVEAGREMLYEVPFSDDGHLTGVRIDPNGKPCRWRIDWIELASADGGKDWGGAEIALQTRASKTVTFRVTDDPDRPAMAAFEITDETGRVYPPQSKRLAPDFFFQRQIYRGDGETIRLPAGKYQVKCARGPETIPETVPLVVSDGPAEVHYQVKRWIDPSRRGYWSGDHHIHAAGCAHYENPTQGVHPPDMLRHCMGEDLKVGCCLTWGPCFDFQKRFFTGELDNNSRYPYLIRYDVEVSGFGSHVSGHLNLLRLKEQIPPGGDSKEHWPTLGLNTLRWAKKQGAVCGPAHSSSGLTRFVDRVPGTEGLDGSNGLPTYNVPAFDGIGANEFIMNVAHTVEGPNGNQVQAVDFISTMNSERTAEFNMWYHVLNCGFPVRASGETDFPCMSGERVGIGRVYARVDGELNFDRWCDSLAAGRSYVSDGRTHLMEFTAQTSASKPLEIGTSDSTFRLTKPESVTFTVQAAALYLNQPASKVELIVNGYPVAEQSLPVDGNERTIRFAHAITQSSWAAIRVFPNAHTNPVFITVDDKPIRANRHSAEWCLRSLDICWKSKAHTYRAEERPTAEQDYETARQRFRTILKEHTDAPRK
ncbi:MAG: CehA/McbA family metallohydrolase [Pirellulales bacterium]